MKTFPDLVSPRLLRGRYHYFHFNKGLSLRDIKYLAHRQIPRRGQNREAHLELHTLPSRPFFVGSFAPVNKHFSHRHIFPPEWEWCPCSCLSKARPGLLFSGDLLQLFNCHYLFEHLEFAVNSLSRPDSSQIQYSVSFQLFCFPPALKRLVTL